MMVFLMRDGFDRVSQGLAWAEVGPKEGGSEETREDDLSAMEQVLWCPNRGQLRRIAREECERHRSEADPECTNPSNQLAGWHFCMGGNWRKRVFWVEPSKYGVVLHIRFEDKE
jgi:hypothetical protein